MDQWQLSDGVKDLSLLGHSACTSRKGQERIRYLLKDFDIKYNHPEKKKIVSNSSFLIKGATIGKIHFVLCKLEMVTFVS